MSGISVHVRLTPKQQDELDEWRRNQRDVPSAPEAMRRMLEQATAHQDEEADDGRREVADV
jgi:hypothetical protein